MMFGSVLELPCSGSFSVDCMLSVEAAVANDMVDQTQRRLQQVHAFLRCSLL